MSWHFPSKFATQYFQVVNLRKQPPVFHEKANSDSLYSPAPSPSPTAGTRPRETIAPEIYNIIFYASRPFFLQDDCYFTFTCYLHNIISFQVGTYELWLRVAGVPYFCTYGWYLRIQ